MTTYKSFITKTVAITIGVEGDTAQTTGFIGTEAAIAFQDFVKNYETVVCADGFEMSVQASRGHYCSPREDVGPYTTVEIGFPNRRDELLMPHIELADQPAKIPQALARSPC